MNGIKAKHAIVSKQCRINKGELGAGSEAVQRLMEEYYELVKLPANEDAKFHFILKVERPINEKVIAEVKNGTFEK